MRWEELTGDAFPQAVKDSQGVCLLPLSVIERHGHHLPLGTDMYIARAICNQAATLEPAVIFPDFIFTQILEARHCAGTIAIDGELLLPLLDNICREIARNGFKKIVIVNAHGGNQALIPLFCQSQLGKPRDYVVYAVSVFSLLSTVEVTWETGGNDHAGESETSLIQAIRPDLVDPRELRSDGEGDALGRLKHLRDKTIYTGIWWYGDHPTHYAGDGVPASAEKGRQALQGRSEALAEVIRLIKADETARQLQDHFYAASGSPE